MKKDKLEPLLKEAKIETLQTALEDILKMEYFLPIAEGAEKADVDYELTLRMVRTRARMTLDVVKSMSSKSINK